MREILDQLPKQATVLDLGCAAGSFDATRHAFRTIRTDLEAGSGAGFVQADAARLPFADHSFDAVICNHSLEHFEGLEQAVAEIGRVVKADGALYVSVPDARTFTDRLYRWLARGGGHVNAFTSPELLAGMLGRRTGLAHVGTRTLCTSFSFLNRRNARARLPRKLWLLGGGREMPLLLLCAGLRWLDRLMGTRAAVYGWGMYFGAVREQVQEKAWVNVCVRCGAGHASAWLEESGAAHGWGLMRWYRCPGCSAGNWFWRDELFRY